MPYFPHHKCPISHTIKCPTPHTYTVLPIPRLCFAQDALREAIANAVVGKGLPGADKLHKLSINELEVGSLRKSVLTADLPGLLTCLDVACLWFMRTESSIHLRGRLVISY